MWLIIRPTNRLAWISLGGIDIIAIIACLVSIVLLILWLSARSKLKRNQLNSDLVHREADVKFQTWKSASEVAIRRDAIAKSQSVRIGKYSEHFAPYLSDFEYDPRDARFIGSPIDFVVFDGLSDDEEVVVVFIEIKTGNSNLSRRQRKVREAVLNGRVLWKVMKIDKSVSC